MDRTGPSAADRGLGPAGPEDPAGQRQDGCPLPHMTTREVTSESALHPPEPSPARPAGPLRNPADLVRVALGLAVVGVGFLVAQQGQLSVAERDVFRLINDLPGIVFPVVWVVMQLGNVVAVPTVAAAAALTRQLPHGPRPADLRTAGVRGRRPREGRRGPGAAGRPARRRDPARGPAQRRRLHLRSCCGRGGPCHRRGALPEPAQPPGGLGVRLVGGRRTRLRRRPPPPRRARRGRRRLGDRFTGPLGVRRAALGTGDPAGGRAARPLRAARARHCAPPTSGPAARTRSTPWTTTAAAAT